MQVEKRRACYDTCKIVRQDGGYFLGRVKGLKCFQIKQS